MNFIHRLGAAATAFALCAGIAGAQAVLEKKGTEFDAKLLTTLSSKTSHDGDTFTMSPKNGLFHKHPELDGVTIEGHVENVTAAGPTHKASMNIIFDDFKFSDGHTVPVHLRPAKMNITDPKTHHIRDMGLIVGGAVAGHITSKKTGVGGGTLAGAAAGFALASAMKSDIVLKSGSTVTLKTLDDITQ